MEDTKTIAPDELLMEQLINRNWEDFWLRLMGRCAWLIRKRYGLKWSNDDLKDFSRKAIGEIIDKIFLEKERKWYTDSNPDFEDFIVSALDSHVNNTLNKKNSEIGYDHLLRNFAVDEGEPSQSDVIITAELRKEVFEELQKAGADDEELLVFECLADGINKPEKIREELGLTEDDFHNIWRRLKRKREVIQKKLAAYGY